MQESPAIVLNKQPSGENFFQISFLTQNNGKLLCLLRKSKKINIDLFDISLIQLSPQKNNGPAFLKDHLLQYRHNDLPKHYNAFSYACRWAKLLLANLDHIDQPAYLYNLTQKALKALESSPNPDIVYFKSLYLFLKQEGYPVKEDWLQQLPPDIKQSAIQSLKLPSSSQKASPHPFPDSLELWAQNHGFASD